MSVCMVLVPPSPPPLPPAPPTALTRILEKGIMAFRLLESLEVSECALRGDTLRVVLQAIKKHKTLEKVRRGGAAGAVCELG